MYVSFPPLWGVTDCSSKPFLSKSFELLYFIKVTRTGTLALNWFVLKALASGLFILVWFCIFFFKWVLVLDNQVWVSCIIVISLSTFLWKFSSLWGCDWVSKLPPSVLMLTPSPFLSGCLHCHSTAPGLTGLLHDGGFSVGVRWGRRILIAPCAKKNRAKSVSNNSFWLPKTLWSETGGACRECQIQHREEQPQVSFRGFQRQKSCSGWLASLL